jgi:hypothetical protein
MKRRPDLWKHLTNWWAQESILSAFLVLLVVMALALPAVITVGWPGRLLTDLFFSLVLITGVFSISLRPWVSHTLKVVTVITLTIRWVSWLFELETTQVLQEWATLATMVCFAIVVLSKVLTTGSVTRARIEGAVAAYLLLGLSWASAYKLVALYNPAAFQGPIESSASGLAFTYFSFVTLTTVGFGDITPVLPLARSLAVTEALTGQLYLAILLARLVSLELHQRHNQERR